MAWTGSYGRLLIPAKTIWAVDTSGVLWAQTSVFNLPYGHWYKYSKPTGTSATSGPATVVGSDGARHVFVTTANGHVFEFNGNAWTDRGKPAGTNTVGTPVAGANGAAPRVVVLGANGHVEELLRNSTGAYRWVDLGNPGAGAHPDAGARRARWLHRGRRDGAERPPRGARGPRPVLEFLA